eukprot:gene18136-23790_t
MSCNTSFWTKAHCNGCNNKCNGCNAVFCKYHFVAVQACRVVGGHVCPNACDTSVVYVQNCSGGNSKCIDCKYRFCDYHFKAVGSALVPVGGHVCTTTAGALAVDALMNADLGTGVSIGRINALSKVATKLTGNI